MAKKPANHGKKWLIFIDTNIFLDFYRIRGDIKGLSLLDRIGVNLDKIITSDQVEMEFMKNRHTVMLNALSQLKTAGWTGLAAPAFLADSQLAQAIVKNRKNVEDQHKRMRNKISKILKNPSQYDPVYKNLGKLFSCDGSYHLTRKKQIRYTIRRLARKRYMLGYPPRKDKDTSFGDAINWEWIVHCAKESGKHIIIVSRDTDYGINHEGESSLNDCLTQEFKERVSSKRKIVLTARLSDAFKMVAVKVTQAEEKQEQELIDAAAELLEESDESYSASNFLKYFKQLAAERNKLIHDISKSSPFLDLGKDKQ
jgi:hypothetical protein